MSIPTSTPLFGGELAIAHTIAANSAPNRWLLIGDSVVYTSDSFRAEILRRWQVTLTDQWKMASLHALNDPNSSQVGVVTDFYTGPASGVYGRIGTYAPWGSEETSFAGGNSGAGNLTDVPGIRSSTLDVDVTAANAEFWAGNPWGRVATTGLVRSVYRRHPLGNPQVAAVNRVRVSSTNYAFSTAFATYAASADWIASDVAVPTNVDFTGTTFSVDQMYTGSTPTPAGTYNVLSGVWISSGEGKFGLFPVGVPGADHDFWLDVNNFSTACWSTLVPMLGFTGLIILLGINNHGGDSAATYKTKITELITRFRTGVPNGPVILIAPHASATVDQTAGGDTGEDWFCAPLYQLATSLTNVLFLNINRAWGPYHAVTTVDTADGTHPNTQGYVNWAAKSWSLIEAASTSWVDSTAAPSSLTALSSLATTMDLAWVAGAGQTGYDLDVATDSLFQTIIQSLHPASNATSLAVTGLTPQTTYFFRLRATASGVASNYTTTSAITGHVPNAPSDCTATITSSGNLVTWTDNSDDETGFGIALSVDGGSFEDYSGASANVTNFLDLQDPGHTYTYRIRAIHGANDSGWSNEATAAIEPTQLLASLTTRDAAGNIEAGVTIKFRLTEPPSGDGNSYAGEKVEATSGYDGVLLISLLRSAWYIGRRGQGEEVPFFTGDEDTFDLPNFPSRPDPL